MVMGPTHATMGTIGGLAVSAAYMGVTQEPLHPAYVTQLAIIGAGAALAPDLDSKMSTVNNSLGVFRYPLWPIVNGTGVAVHSITRTRKDKVVEGGHRTFFHTTVAAILAGVGVGAAAMIPDEVTILGQTLTWGSLLAILITGFFTNLALAGLFEKQIKKKRKQFGPYVLILFSILIAIAMLFWTPDGVNPYFLGFAVAFGWFVHLIGDGITKMGVPMLWPLKINGKRWWDVALPSFMRITAGGPAEAWLFAGFTVLLAALILVNVLMLGTLGGFA